MHFTSQLNRIVEKLLRVLAGISNDENFSFGIHSRLQNYLLKKAIKAYDIDLIHLHWGGMGFMPLKSFHRITVPLAITAHDYYYFTGGCHVPMDCPHYLLKCDNCPLTKRHWAKWYIRNKLKKNIELLKSFDLRIITPSIYTKDKIKSIHRELNVEVVSNTIGNIYYSNKDTIDIYINNINDDKVYTIITVGVCQSNRNNKGLDVLIETLVSLHHSKIRTKLISIGEYIPIVDTEEYIHLSFVSSLKLIELYSIADLCIVPSRYETFSQVTLESIVCGTPVVAFDLTGPKDIINDNVSGFLVKSFDIHSFVNTVHSAIDYKRDNIDLMKEYAYKALREHAPEMISQRHDLVYNTRIL